MEDCKLVTVFNTLEIPGRVKAITEIFAIKFLILVAFCSSNSQQYMSGVKNCFILEHRIVDKELPDKMKWAREHRRFMNVVRKDMQSVEVTEDARDRVR